MKTTIIAAAAVLATAVVADDCGSALVVNACDYDVYLTNVPASGGGYEESSHTLPANSGKYSQTWTSLSNQQGWSMKLSKTKELSSIMQYEYTYHDDGIIWFDLSNVNGNPWDGNWDWDADNGCDPKHTAYQYSTDDANGMQASCPSNSSITVTLCSGNANSGSSSGSGSPAPSSPSPSPSPEPAPAPAPAPSSSSAAPAAAPSSNNAAPSQASPAAPALSGGALAYSNNHWSNAGDNEQAAGGNERIASPASPSTTLTTAVTTPAPSVGNAAVVIVTETEIAYTTVDTFVKRDLHHHAHHLRHPHGRRL